MKKNQKRVSLLLRYSIITLLSAVLFGYAFGMLLSRSMEQSMFNKSAEETADIVVQNVVKHFKEKELIDPKTGRKHHKFSHRMDHLSLGKDIINTKIWNRDFRLVWDKKKESVGKELEDTIEVADLRKAFSGTTVIEADSFKDLEVKHHRTPQEKRILELYVPIRFSPEGQIMSVFEVYQNLDPLYATISHHKKMIWLWTISGFSSLYVVLFGGFWQASRQINMQTREISQAKQEWEETFDTITDMITVHDTELNVLRANRAAREIHGSSIMDEIHTKCYQYFHGLDEPPEWCPGLKCLKTGETATADMFNPHLNKFLDIRAIPRFDSNNNMIGFIHDVRDISDFKNAEDEKANLQNQLLQTQKMDSIGRLAGGVAHDFNNILSVIIGYSEISLKELPQDNEVKSNIQTILDSGERAAALTKQLLAFSRKQVLEMKAVDVNIIFENMIKMLKRLISENVQLEFSPQNRLNKILADPTQLEQILLNLAVNARDAMPDGGRLTITTNEVEFRENHLPGGEKAEPGTYVRLAVTDTGTGMGREVMEKIFEPFFSTKGVGKGTGMGLSTVYGIVKQHKGHIAVFSELNKGTSFEVYFPIAEDLPDDVAEDTIHSALTGNETILVVDDEPLLLKVIAQLLEPLGYEILQASHYEEALKVSDNFNGKIDLLLTDLVMPEMNGKELSDILKKKRPDMNVLYMSGYTDDTIAEHGILDKEMALIHKPITEKVLAAKIRQLMDSSLRPAEVQKDAHNMEGMHILLADDNTDIRMLIQSFLNKYDCRIDTAENGQIALEKFKEGTYDLVLMDMQMPVMDGISAIIEIRKWETAHNHEEIPVIALTGYSAQEDVDRCLEAGYTSHIAKPIKREGLIKALLSFRERVKPDTGTVNNDGEEIFIARVDTELEKLVPTFLEERHSDIDRIQKALLAEDYETIRILGHSMKGSGGGFGFDTITDIGIDLENAAMEKDSQGVIKLVDQLEDYMENVEIIYE